MTQDESKITLKPNVNHVASDVLRLVSIVDASGGVTKLEYGLSDPLRITALVDPYGRRAKISYDHRGRLVQIIDAAGLVSHPVFVPKPQILETFP